MQLHGILVLVLAFVGFSASPAVAVYGGYKVDNIKDYPHQAAIQEKTNLGPRFIASGAILSSQIVVTVASAVSEYSYRPTDLLVRVGSSQTGSDGAQHDVAELHQYSPQWGIYDVAVLKLSTPITWSKNVNFINLPRVYDRPLYGQTSFVSSWGKYEDGIYATTLRHAALTASNDGCYPYMRAFGSENNASVTYQQSSMLCLSNQAGGTCTNDDGAPLVFKGLLAGLATRWGFGCDNKYRYGGSLFVDVSSWEVWHFLQEFLLN